MRQAPIALSPEKANQQHYLVTLKVTMAIYYQALRLWLKRTPLYNHPTHSHSVDDQQQKR